jgi:hypothetical protein
MARAFVGVASLECPEHGGLQAVVDIHVWEWRVSCDTPRCTFAHWCGLSQIQANFLANKHARTRPGHQVGYAYVINGVAARVQQKMQKSGAI